MVYVLRAGDLSGVEIFVCLLITLIYMLFYFVSGDRERKREEQWSDGFDFDEEEKHEPIRTEYVPSKELIFFPELDDLPDDTPPFESVFFGGMEWLVLHTDPNGDRLLIAQDVLECRAFAETDEDILTFDASADLYWLNAEVRRVLNEEFLQRFDEADQERILRTPLENHDNPWYNTPAYTDHRRPIPEDKTEDKIFLLSAEEVLLYFGGELPESPDGDDGVIRDLYNELRRALLDGEPATWWLRTPGCFTGMVTFVDADGGIVMDGAPATTAEIGVRPAMWVTG